MHECRTYAPIPKRLHAQLMRIEPSENRSLQGSPMQYYPCQVRLKNGIWLDRVYVVPREPYRTMWGVYPEDDAHKQSIVIADVAEIRESPSRLPAKFANEVYKVGELGMGWCAFIVKFIDGSRRLFVTGNAVDFIEYPEGLTPLDVHDVEIGRPRSEEYVKGPSYIWCLFDGVSES